MRASQPPATGGSSLDEPFDDLVGAPARASDDVRADDAGDDVERGSRLDDWWGRMLRTPARRRAWSWGGPAAVTLLAAVLRLWNIGQPHALVFDETFYVKDAWTLWNNGYESTWPDKADPLFNAGQTDIFTTTGSYVVHPPIGKWLIGAGMELFGPDSSVGWRISTAVVGILAVLLVTLIARRLFDSPLLGVIAGGLMAIDGHAIVMSRVALLDTTVMFFALCGFGCVLLDRRWHEERLAAAIARRAASDRPITWGPAIWARPWVVAAGVCFGLCTATKWSGLYFLAAFGLYLVVVDMLARRRAGIPFWASASILKQGPATFLLLVPVAFAVYLASWTGWLSTSGGYDRQWAAVDGNAWTGPFSWVPLPLQSLVHYHESMYAFHVGLSTPHPYQSNPLTWLLMIRPVAMWYEGVPDGTGGCHGGCVTDITSIANPLIWWAAGLAALFLVVRLVLKREWQAGLILAGIAAGYLPWLLYLHRTVFQFYTIAFEPYLLLALTLVIGLVLGRRTDERYRRVGGIRAVAVFGIACVLLSAFWYPLWTATPVPTWFVMLHYWLPSWI
ncbi:C-terminal four TMM region of protein-O-mannosyltransferase [Paramicrobacterium humi]|uniref:Polyprenol-phosphate-mannose--protein mannosyltransferase n=1 Tax=Paramicrobacterium humi TaxID=640635 RepID=A0A1H4IQE8_9MICO|nr:phospholipid carrier-dependent glycosyltransferase [Microbacterium humi]SEB36279.1 C-terminal four TMM region of protein-O-mannosyltransferase [Microbacterium humi]